MSLLSRNGWFDRTYLVNLTTAKRYHTFKAALTLLQARKPAGASIVETGCQREVDDWGAGSSTTVLGNYCKLTGGHLDSIDNDRIHLERCERIVIAAGLDKHVTLHHTDSVGWLLQRPADYEIDLLYLDSFDYPYGKILEEYGGKTDIDTARKVVEAMSDAEIVEKHGSIIAESQEHCVAEIRAAEHLLMRGSVVLIDDVLPGGGKPRLASEWLRADPRWLPVLEDYQTLWVRL